jgi:hypothetical protein
MADKKELARQYMELQRDNKIDESMAMLSDDVVATNPMTGTQTGKAAVEAGIRNRPQGGGAGDITWSEPAEEGGDIKIVGTGSPFGPIRILLGFDGSDKINKIDIGLGS